MIKDEDVKKLANLARIDMSDEEVNSMTKEIDGILGYVDKIKSVEMADEEVLTGGRNVFREDSNPHESGEFTKDILDNAPDSDSKYIKVKDIL